MVCECCVCMKGVGEHVCVCWGARENVRVFHGWGQGWEQGGGGCWWAAGGLPTSSSCLGFCVLWRGCPTLGGQAVLSRPPLPPPFPAYTPPPPPGAPVVSLSVSRPVCGPSDLHLSPFPPSPPPSASLCLSVSLIHLPWKEGLTQALPGSLAATIQPFAGFRGPQ